jgi:hypothetical protein
MRSRWPLDELHYRDPPDSLQRIPVDGSERKLPTLHFSAKLFGIGSRALSDNARSQPCSVSDRCLPAHALIESDQAFVR